MTIKWKYSVLLWLAHPTHHFLNINCIFGILLCLFSFSLGFFPHCPRTFRFLFQSNGIYKIPKESIMVCASIYLYLKWAGTSSKGFFLSLFFFFFFWLLMPSSFLNTEEGKNREKMYQCRLSVAVDHTKLNIKQYKDTNRVTLSSWISFGPNVSHYLINPNYLWGH